MWKLRSQPSSVDLTAKQTAIQQSIYLSWPRDIASPSNGHRGQSYTGGEVHIKSEWKFQKKSVTCKTGFSEFICKGRLQAWPGLVNHFRGFWSQQWLCMTRYYTLAYLHMSGDSSSWNCLPSKLSFLISVRWIPVPRTTRCWAASNHFHCFLRCCMYFMCEVETHGFETSRIVCVAETGFFRLNFLTSDDLRWTILTINW